MNYKYFFLFSEHNILEDHLNTQSELNNELLSRAEALTGSYEELSSELQQKSTEL